jgi:hypothetical protein
VSPHLTLRLNNFGDLYWDCALAPSEIINYLQKAAGRKDFAVDPNAIISYLKKAAERKDLTKAQSEPLVAVVELVKLRVHWLLLRHFIPIRATIFFLGTAGCQH